MRATLWSLLLEHLEPTEAMAWLDAPHVELDGLTPAQLIVRDGYDDVIRVARADLDVEPTKEL